jgi:hypothetical protein
LALCQHWNPMKPSIRHAQASALARAVPFAETDFLPPCICGLGRMHGNIDDRKSRGSVSGPCRRLDEINMFWNVALTESGSRGRDAKDGGGRGPRSRIHRQRFATDDFRLPVSLRSVSQLTCQYPSCTRSMCLRLTSTTSGNGHKATVETMKSRACCTRLTDISGSPGLLARRRAKPVGRVSVDG